MNSVLLIIVLMLLKLLMQEAEALSAEKLLSGSLKVPIIKALLLELSTQCQNLCRKKEFSSILRQLEPTQLTDFRFRDLLEKWKKVAPLLLQFLCAVANVAVLEDGLPPETAFPSLCTAGAILLKQRNLHMSAVHHIIGVILFHGNTSKQVCVIIIIELLIPNNASFTEGSCAVKPSWPFCVS